MTATGTAALKPFTVARKRRRRGRLTHRPIGYLFVLPALALLAVFQLYPIVVGAWLSLHEWSGLSEEQPFVGLANFTSVLSDPIFWTSMTNALKFGVLGVVVGGSLALAMALLVNARTRLTGFFRAVLFLPWMLSPVVFGFLWTWILDPNVGPVNRALGWMVGHVVSIAWLGTPSTAFWLVALVFVWAHWGFGFLIFLSGLQGIPRELLEAALLDGANARQRFVYIVWPLLAPVVVLVSVVSLLLAMQIFGTVLVMTNGGPGYSTQVPTLLIYQEAFVNFRVGRGAAISVIFGVFLVAISGAQVWAGKRWSHD